MLFLVCCFAVDGAIGMAGLLLQVGDEQVAQVLRRTAGQLFDVAGDDIECTRCEILLDADDGIDDEVGQASLRQAALEGLDWDHRETNLSAQNLGNECCAFGAGVTPGGVEQGRSLHEPLLTLASWARSQQGYIEGARTKFAERVAE